MFGSINNATWWFLGLDVTWGKCDSVPEASYPSVQTDCDVRQNLALFPAMAWGWQNLRLCRGEKWLESYFHFTHTLSWVLQGHLYHNLIMPSCKEWLCLISALHMNLWVFSAYCASSCIKVNTAFNCTHVLCSKTIVLCVFQQPHNTSMLYMFRSTTDRVRYTKVVYG